MPATLNPTITSSGLDAAVTADGLGLAVGITHVALGAGQYAVTGAETALQDLREVAPISDGSESGTGQITIHARFDSALYAGAVFDAGEIGFFIGDPQAGGKLFALHSAPGYVHARRGSTFADLIETYTLQLAAVPPGSVTVLVDPEAATAYELLRLHGDKPHPHPQYVRHDAPQGLTEAQMGQGRANLGLRPRLYFFGQS